MSHQPSQPPAPSARMTGAASLIRSLEAAGVDTVFGIPGGAIMPAYDPLLDSTGSGTSWSATSRAAGYAAEGYARATGRVGVCMATSGPGATNLVTAIADAHMDSVPIVAITGQVPERGDRHRRVPGEPTSAAITMPITKHNYLVTDPARFPRTIAEAFHIAATGRPGPVLVDVPKDVLQARPHFRLAASRSTCPATGRRPAPHSKQVREAARLIASAQRPVFYVGGGVIRAGRLARAAASSPS